MPGAKMKSEMRPDGLLGSQSKVAVNSSRASSAMSEEDAIAGYDASQNTAWHPSSSRSASARPNANRTSNQLPTEYPPHEDDSSDNEGTSPAPGKLLSVSGRGYEQDQASVHASESDVHDDPVGSEELEFNETGEDVDDSKSEESIKSFGDEEYTPSQRLAGPRSESFQKAQRVSTRSAKQKPVRTGNPRSSKGRDHSAEGGDSEESDTVHATPVGKAGVARGKQQKALSQRIAKAASVEHFVNDRPTKQMQQHEEQGTRALPFKRRIAKKPFTPGNEDSASKTSLSKAHAKDSASTYSDTGTKGKNTAEVRSRATPQKGVDATTSPTLYEVEGSSEPDDKRNLSADPPRKRSDPRAKSQDARKLSQRQRSASGSRAANPRNGKSTMKGTQKKSFDDDIIDDDGPSLSLSISATKPNSKKRRSSPQSYGPRFKKPKNPVVEFSFEDGGGTIAQSSPSERPDSRRCSPDPNEAAPIEISSDAPSSEVAEQDLQPNGSNNTDYPAGQQKLQLTIHDSSAINRPGASPNKKPKTVSTSSYTVRPSPLDQVNASSNSDNDNIMGFADDDAVKNDSTSSSVGTKVQRAGANKEVALSQQEQTRNWNSRNSTPMKTRTTKFSVPVSKNIASNDPFTGPRDPVKDKGSINQHPPPQSAGQRITYDPQPQEAATAPMIEPHPFTGTNTGVSRLGPLDTRPGASWPKPMPPANYQPRVSQETYRYYEKPWEQHPQPQSQRDGFSVQHAQARYAQPSPEQDFTARLNPKTLEFNQKLAAMPSLRHGNPHRQTFVVSPPGQGSSLDLNITSKGPQLDHQTRQEAYVDGANADRVIHRRLSPKQAIINNVVREYDRGSSRITATLLKRQQDEFNPAVSKFHGSFQTISKTFARASQGVKEGAKSSTIKSEALSNKFNERNQHMCKLREVIRQN
ncbi:hypothetical protein PG985_006253 [Apiospora marii]|uniref:Uncharacterized protein n=1 Tax=Apiospora marii TaxID=335849 RepID=A0ABR1S9D9_9PEZI